MCFGNQPDENNAVGLSLARSAGTDVYVAEDACMNSAGDRNVEYETKARYSVRKGGREPKFSQRHMKEHEEKA